jgi:hypothetical protein
MKLASWATSWAIFLAHVMLVGCGTATLVETVEVIKPVPVPFYIDVNKIDAPLVPHVMEFAGYCEKFKISELCKSNFKNITSIRVVRSFPEKFVVGKCYVSSIGDRWVEVLGNWIDSDSMLMKTLVMHEVGHCTLGNPFPHYDDEDDIMNSHLLPEKLVQAYWPELIKAMFTRAGGKLSLTSQPEVASVTSTMIDESGGLSCEKEN